MNLLDSIQAEVDRLKAAGVDLFRIRVVVFPEKWIELNNAVFEAHGVSVIARSPVTSVRVSLPGGLDIELREYLEFDPVASWMIVITP